MNTVLIPFRMAAVAVGSLVWLIGALLFGGDDEAVLR